MYSIIYLAVWFAGSAMFARQGMWSNTIALLNIILSGLAAFSFYSPLTIYLDEKLNGQYTYVLDFVCVWAIFTVSMLILKGLTGLASGTRMRFKHPIDPIGSAIMGELASWVMAAIVMATLHMSPMPRDAFSGELAYEPEEVYSGMALFSPDRGWLRFVERATDPTSLGRSDKKGFSAQAFVKIYSDHRAKLEKAPGLRAKRS